MGFNCAQEKAKFDREWLRLRKEYTDAGNVKRISYIGDTFLKEARIYC